MTARRVAFITGGGSGIGQASAHALARIGMDVVLVDLSEVRAQKVAAEIASFGVGTLALHCDVSDEASVRAAVERTEAHFGRLDVLVASAGVDFQKELEDTLLEDWRRVIEINVTGAFLCIKHARRLMVAQRHGRIICLGSATGIFGLGWPAYSTAKAALHGLALSAARELAPFGITVNVVAPGPVETPMTTELWKNNPGRRERLGSAMPIGRLGRPEEIAGAIAYLAADNSGFVTGSTLVIDGGLTSLMRRSAASS